jgi:hypothetical protein
MMFGSFVFVRAVRPRALGLGVRLQAAIFVLLRHVLQLLAVAVIGLQPTCAITKRAWTTDTLWCKVIAPAYAAEGFRL